MTLAELEAVPREWLTCAQVAPLLGADRANIHDQAVTAPELLGFPVIVIKSRVKIPKKPFIRFMTGLE
jgi:hypothetical protein